MKILLMTGYADPRFVKDGGLSRGVELIQKPFWLRDLLKKVREILNR
jgi:hypothetical protein